MRVAVIDRRPAMRAGFEAILERGGVEVVADADGVLDSGAQPREIIESLRIVAAGGTAFPELTARERADLARRLPAEDHAILAMRLAATPRREISDTLRIDARSLRRRLLA